MKKINVFCVLVLALMLIDFVVDLFLNTSDASVELKLENESLGFVLFTFFFALLIAEVFCIGMKLQENHP